MSLPMAYYTSDATVHCLFPAETAFSARRNRLFRASEKHISYGGRACLAAQERLFRIPEQSLSDGITGKPADCQHVRQTAKKTAYLQPKDCPRANTALFPDYDEYLFTQRTAFLHIHAFCVPLSVMHPAVPHAALPHLPGA